MSPEAEAGKSEAQTQTGSDKFVDIGHPTGDRARLFKQGDLPDVHDEMQKRGVPDAGVIDPLTLETPVDKITLATEVAPTEATPITTETTSKWKRWVAGLIGGAVLTGVGIAVGSAMSGDDTEPNRSETSTSAGATPTSEGEGVGPSEVPTPEVPENIEMLMLQPQGTAEELLGNSAAVISGIINARVEAGVPVPNDADLQYLLDSNANSGDIAAFKSYVQSLAGNVVEMRQLREEQGADPDVDIAIYSNFVSGEPTADGGFVIESQDEYWAIGEDGQASGTILDNLDTHRYTFIRTDVQLPNGSFKNTFVLSKFENIQQTATE